MAKYKQGFYTPEYPDKWIITESFDTNGNAIKFRSSWELKFCRFADFNPDIVKVNSEGIVIPYLNPIKNKVSRYYMDFIIETKNGNVFLVEIKPKAQTLPPKKPKKITPKSELSYKKAIETYLINQAKWQAAEEYAKERGMKFIIITEKEIGL